ncbi:hemolymph lipopolysaccharide-binding protein-like [Ooceraea biroi]|uniref:hemolymph lipopolysaccharide-binding protein-like n=1 Tax=Ooceraea biroi TaxID=2015173 RepID=UPI0009715D44|nr:hemolymph lipopolysaccharide-binding protein-like [Ooceraea biroi]
MNGHYNYHVGQQIIYVYGQQQFKRLFTANNLEEKSVGGDYLITSGIGAHKLHLRRLCWNKARQVCVHEGGQLAVINSFSEEKILLRMLQENNLTVAWLGIHDLYEEGDWVTVKGEPLGSTGYTSWITLFGQYPQPNNGGGTEHCATLAIEGGRVGMNDLTCNAWNLPFFCEITV